LVTKEIPLEKGKIPQEIPQEAVFPSNGGGGGEGGVDILNNTLFGRVLVIFFSVVGGGTVEKEGDRELFQHSFVVFLWEFGLFWPRNAKNVKKCPFFGRRRCKNTIFYPPIG